jgi:hypothetical protein
MDRGKTVYPPPPLGSGGIIMKEIYFVNVKCRIAIKHISFTRISVLV